MVQGKQIANYTLTKDLFKINTGLIIKLTDITNKEYVDSISLSAITTVSNNNVNKNMLALNTNSNSGYQLMCDTPILLEPYSSVSVMLNGVEINVGFGLDCAFSNDSGITFKSAGTEEIGDYLYWNTNNYQLDSTDEIDFVYLIKTIKKGIGYDTIGYTKIK